VNARRGVWRHWAAAVLLAGVLFGLVPAAAANPLTVSPVAILAEEYNDNIYFDSQKVEDYITTLALGLSLGYQTPSSTTVLNTGIGGSYFARRSVATVDLAQAQQLRFSSQYHYSPRLTFTINDRLARVGNSSRNLGAVGASGAGLTTADTAALDPSQANPGGVNILLPRGSALTNSFGVTASYLLTPLWTGGLSYAYGINGFTDPNSTDQNHRVGVLLSHQLSQSLSVSGNYSYSHFITSNAPDSDGHTATLGAGYAFDPLWSAFGSVGASVNQPVGSSAKVSTAFSAGLDRSSERWLLSGAVQQGLTPSAGVAGTSVTLGAYVNFQIQLTEYLSGLLRTSYTNFDTSTGSFDVYQLRVALFYPVWRNVNAGLVYAYRRRDSNQTISNSFAAGTIDGNIVLLQIGTTFQLWQLDV
jgi:hypothetical protein